MNLKVGQSVVHVPMSFIRVAAQLQIYDLDWVHQYNCLDKTNNNNKIFTIFGHYDDIILIPLTIFGLGSEAFGTIAFLAVLGAFVAGWEEAAPAGDSLTGAGGIKEDAVKILKLLQTGCRNELKDIDNNIL